MPRTPTAPSQNANPRNKSLWKTNSRHGSRRSSPRSHPPTWKTPSGPNLTPTRTSSSFFFLFSSLYFLSMFSFSPPVRTQTFLKEKNFKQKIPQEKVEDGEEITHEKATATLRRAAHFFSALQASDGHWPAEFGGLWFFLPPLVMCLYITGHLNIVFPAENQREILRDIYYHQNEDGGWGLHVEGHSIMFSTALSYICMRMLGEGPDGGRDNACARARKWILDHGGATHIPSWGKT